MIALAVTAIIAFFVLFALYIWADIQDRREEEAADEIGAGEQTPYGGFRGLTAAGADTSYKREWTLARSRPYDWDREDEVA